MAFRKHTLVKVPTSLSDMADNVVAHWLAHGAPFQTVVRGTRKDGSTYETGVQRYRPLTIEELKVLLQYVVDSGKAVSKEPQRKVKAKKTPEEILMDRLSRNGHG